MIIKEIADIDPLTCYINLRYDAYPFLLDSSIDHSGLGRYSFVGANPFLTFRAHGDEMVNLPSVNGTVFSKTHLPAQ